MVVRMCSIALLLLAHGVMHKGSGYSGRTPVDLLCFVDLKEQDHIFCLMRQALEADPRDQAVEN